MDPLHGTSVVFRLEHRRSDARGVPAVESHRGRVVVAAHNRRCVCGCLLAVWCGSAWAVRVCSGSPVLEALLPRQHAHELEGAAGWRNARADGAIPARLRALEGAAYHLAGLALVRRRGESRSLAGEPGGAPRSDWRGEAAGGVSMVVEMSSARSPIFRYCCCHEY